MSTKASQKDIRLTLDVVCIYIYKMFKNTQFIRAVNGLSRIVIVIYMLLYLYGIISVPSYNNYCLINCLSREYFI